MYFPYIMLSKYFQEGSTPFILAVMNGHKDVVLLLLQKGANLEHVNNVSVHILILFHILCITEVIKQVVCP